MFEAIIEDTYFIAGRGIIAIVHLPEHKVGPLINDDVEIWNPDGTVLTSVIVGVEMRALPYGPRPQDPVGLLLRSSETLKKKEDIQRGAYMRRAR